MAVWDGRQFVRTIHSIESDYFRSKFEPDLAKFNGRLGIGVISDNDSQPLVVGSHLGTFAIVTVARIVNMAELTAQAYRRGQQFSESTGGGVNPTELEGGQAPEAEILRDYACAGTPRRKAMIEAIRRRLHLTTLTYQTMDDLVAAIGLPKEKLCTHCWDGSSYF